MITIRPFEQTEADYQHHIAVLTACWPEYGFTVESARFRDQTRDPDRLFQRCVLLWDGEHAGIGTYYKPRVGGKPGHFGVDILVPPAFRRRGLGSAFYGYALRALEKSGEKPRHLSSETREDQPEALQFLQKRGFKITMRFPRSRLTTATFDPHRFDTAFKRVAAAGITIHSLADLMAADSEALRKFWQMSEIDIMKDVPLPGKYNPRSFELFSSQFIDDPEVNPETIFVAVEGGRQVGMSALFIENEASRLWMTGLTGVVRDYRRRGVATALKVRAISTATAAGAAVIETDNEENNPMYDLNMLLGFVPQPAWLELERDLPVDSTTIENYVLHT